MQTEPIPTAALGALRVQLSNLEMATAGLIRIALELPQGVLHDQLVERVSIFDSIAGAMHAALYPRNWTDPPEEKQS
jgi:hypothetical protein